jgi:hypothetical protein
MALCGIHPSIVRVDVRTVVGAAVPFEDDFAEVVRLGGVELPEPEVVDDEDFGGEHAAENFVGPVMGARLLEVLEDGRRA